MSNGGNQANIQPFEQVTTKVFNSFRASIDGVHLFTGANIVVECLDSNNIIQDVKMLPLSGDDYANWSNDDDYIMNYVANKLGFTIIPSTSS